MSTVNAERNREFKARVRAVSGLGNQRASEAILLNGQKNRVATLTDVKKVVCEGPGT
jgi:hypothetical protein